MTDTGKETKIVLGVSGGIACYKAVELVRVLVQDGLSVQVIMTRGATEFVTPLTCQTLSGNPVATETFNLTQESEIGHIHLADSADLFVIAPATANIIGKIANGIADEYERPVFLWGREGNDTLKGSCRSGPGSVSVNAIMAAAGDALVSYGGHTASGGFSVAPDKVFTLEESLSEALRSLPEIDAAEALRADAVLAPEEATPELLKRLERLAPFGMKNEKPAFLFQDARIESVAWFGKAGEHLRIKVGRGSEEFPEAPLEAIAFYGRRELGKRVDALASGVRATFLAHLERDQFTRGQPIRLRLIALG